MFVLVRSMNQRTVIVVGRANIKDKKMDIGKLCQRLS